MPEEVVMNPKCYKSVNPAGLLFDGKPVNAGCTCRK